MLELRLVAITYGSVEYEAECALRHQVLRVPLGLSLYDEDLEHEKDHLHFGLFDSSGQIIACLLAVPLSATHAKLRQMAVHASYRGQGIGRQLVQQVETILAQQGVHSFSLHARSVVIGFYAKLGYHLEGAVFSEVGIPHQKMMKQRSATCA
jgi:predicted GNAT family N-acyltransferase